MNPPHLPKFPALALVRRACWGSVAGICLLGSAPAETEPAAPTASEAAPQPSSEPTARGYLGVILTEICPEVRSQTQLKEGEGLMVGRVAPASPAETLGLAHYDILTKFNDQLLMSPSQFVTLVENAGPGTEVKLTYLRRGMEQTGQVTLEHAPRHPVSVDPLPEEMLSRVIRILRDNPAVLESVHRSLTGQGPSRSSGPEAALTLRHGSRLLLRDASGEVELTIIGNTQQIRAWNLVGSLEFQGPVNTPEELAAVPESLRARVDCLLQECRSSGLRRSSPPAADSDARITVPPATATEK